MRQKDVPIFNNTYMMTGSYKRYDGFPTKHEKWLTILKREIVDGGVLGRILKADTMEDVYKMLKSCSFIGEFLAYQYTIDLNYCYEEAIHYVQDNFQDLQHRYGYSHFRLLPGHEPTLIDLQNSFCETDKYLRAKMPELRIGNVRIKQKYRPTDIPMQYGFPPKWGILNR